MEVLTRAGVQVRGIHQLVADAPLQLATWTRQEIDEAQSWHHIMLKHLGHHLLSIRRGGCHENRQHCLA